MESASTERWKPIDIYHNYFVSDYGRIRSAITGEVIPTRNQAEEIGGHPTITIPIENGFKVCLVNKLVATAFIPNLKNKNTFVRNIDDDVNNNRVSNLKWDDSVIDFIVTET